MYSRLMNKAIIEVYYTSSLLDFESQQAYYLSILDKDELAVAARFKFEQLSQRYIISHGLLRDYLATVVHDSAASLRIEKTEFGKPFLPDYPELSFNMSHSGDSLAIAISTECQLGVDIECYKARNGWDGLVNKCFAPEEIAFWYDLDIGERDAAFYRFWVKKEAFVKAVGKGITLGLSQCVVNPENLSSFVSVPEGCGSEAQWQIYALDLPRGAFGAVVCDQQASVMLNYFADNK